MPSFVSHNIFAKELAQSLNDDAKNIIQEYKSIYEMSAQSFDLLKYSFKKNKECTRLCKTCHRINVNRYFEELIKIAKETKNRELVAFIFGSITHNILDANLHPYIVYKTGIYNHTKERLKYRGLHTLIETKYDMFNYQRFYQKTALHKNLKKEFFPPFSVSKETVDSINQVFQNIYQFDGGTYLFFGYKCARMSVNIVRVPNVLNNIYYRIPGKKYLRGYMFERKNITYDFLNVNHRRWVYPSDSSIVKTDSMIDLYNESLNIGRDAINTCYDVIFGNKSIKSFTKIIGNKGYIRGTDCNELKPIKYFEF